MKLDTHIMGEKTIHRIAQQKKVWSPYYGLFKKKLVGQQLVQQLSGEQAVVAGNVMIVT